VTSTLDAVQAALAGEHACVYACGLAGGLLDGSAQEAAAAGRDAHRRRRDGLGQVVLRLGATPVAALPAYALPFAVKDPASARALLADVENRLAAVYADLVAAGATDGLRAMGAAGLLDAAAAAVAWGAAVTALPGIPELLPVPTPS